MTENTRVQIDMVFGILRQLMARLTHCRFRLLGWTVMKMKVPHQPAAQQAPCQAVGNLRDHKEPYHLREVGMAGDWWVRGTRVPAGTRLRVESGECVHEGQARDGTAVFGDLRFRFPSQIAKHFTHQSTNGWKVVQCLVPGDTRWTTLHDRFPHRVVHRRCRW